MKNALFVVLLCILFVSCEEEKSVETKSPTQERAELGDISAQYTLGLKYGSGDGVPQDYVEAATWLRKAAEQGYADSQYVIPSMG